MNNWKQKTLILTVSSIIAASIWIFRPYEKADDSLVEPRLKTIEEPCRAIHYCFYGDGGSVGFIIIDRTGRDLAFCLPAPLDEPTYAHRRLFIGAPYYTEPGSSEVLNPRHTKLRLAEILRSMPDENGDFAWITYLLTRRWRDLWTAIKLEHLTQERKNDTEKGHPILRAIESVHLAPAATNTPPLTPPRYSTTGMET